MTSILEDYFFTSALRRYFLFPAVARDGNSSVADALCFDAWHDASASGPDKETPAACFHLFLPPCRLEL